MVQAPAADVLGRWHGLFMGAQRSGCAAAPRRRLCNFLFSPRTLLRLPQAPQCRWGRGKQGAIRFVRCDLLDGESNTDLCGRSHPLDTDRSRIGIGLCGGVRGALQTGAA